MFQSSEYVGEYGKMWKPDHRYLWTWQGRTCTSGVLSALMISDTHGGRTVQNNWKIGCTEESKQRVQQAATRNNKRRTFDDWWSKCNVDESIFEDITQVSIKLEIKLLVDAIEFNAILNACRISFIQR